jgi:DNA-binding transcriptional LysR family regulator
VEQARHDVGIPRGFRAALTVGGRFGLWEQLLLKWLPLMQVRAPDISIRAEIGLEADLMQNLVEGRLDVGVMYVPQSRPGLTIEPLLEERLVLVSTEGATDRSSTGTTYISGNVPGPGYVYVDWGPEFYAQHSVSFPDFIGPALSANIGWLGLQHVLANGGAGYFPLRVIKPHLETGRLSIVAGTLEFTLQAYLVYPAETASDALQIALEGIREVAAAAQP